MLEKIKQIVKETKSDGITRKLKATKYWNVIDNWSNIPGKGTEKIYLYINQIQKPICSCSSNISLKFISLTKGYNEFCSSRCSAAIKAQTERRNSTMMKRYGNIGLGIKKSRDKQQKTLKERYNINNPGQLKHNIERMKYNNPMFNDISVEKMKATNNKKYGSDCALSSPIIQDKIKKTNIKKYGHKNAMQAKWPSDVLEILTNPEILEQKFKFLGIRGLQSELNVTHQVLMRYLTKYGIRSKLEYLPELDIINYIKLLGYTPLQNDRTIIKPLELDIVIPEMKIAIEHCGLYWHSDSKGKGRNYHKTKTTQANKVGYRLITIFEDEWLSKTEIIKSFLSQLLKKNNKKLYARKTTIKEIPQQEEHKFMNMNHIQGQTTSTKIRYGLFSEDELVSVMSFRKKDQVGTWELVRFCSSIQVIGGASKLFKYFIKLHNPKTVVSFSDNRWFTGGLYPILGFILDKEINPDYSYTKHQKRYHKFNFRKEKLQKRFDIDITNKTERQLTSELGYEMIWDCGKKRWLYTNNNFIQNKPPSSLFFIKS